MAGLSFGHIPGNDTAGDFVDGVADMDSMTVKVKGFPFEPQYLAPAQPQKEGKSDRQLQIGAMNRGKQLLAFGFTVIGCRIGSNFGRNHPIGGILRQKSVYHRTVQSFVKVGMVTAHGCDRKSAFQKRVIVCSDMLWGQFADGKIHFLEIRANGIENQQKTQYTY